jgi:hypothetical protein
MDAREFDQHYVFALAVLSRQHIAKCRTGSVVNMEATVGVAIGKAGRWKDTYVRLYNMLAFCI